MKSHAPKSRWEIAGWSRPKDSKGPNSHADGERGEDFENPLHTLLPTTRVCVFCV
jgi:hypothetical protein